MALLTERLRKILDAIPYYLLLGFMVSPLVIFFISLFTMDWRGFNP